MVHFTLHGFNGTNIHDLLESMGIGRQSLYDTFGDKRQLFLQCIDRYENQFAAGLLEMIESEPDPIEAIEKIIQLIVGWGDDPDSKGCLVTNSLVELGPHDPDVAQRLRSILGKLRIGMEQRLIEAQEAGRLSPDKSPNTLSWQLLGGILSQAVLARAQFGREEMENVSDGLRQLLN